MTVKQRPPLPSEANLAGIMYSIKASEGLIVFTQQDNIADSHTRMWFERDCDGMCWLFAFSDTSNRISVMHIQKAFEIVKECCGDNFER